MEIDLHQQLFEPVRRKGLIVNGGALLVFGSIAAASLLFGIQLVAGNAFVLLMILALISLALFIWVLYRGYALLNARYVLERDGLRIRWGLRIEDIPLNAVEWVRPASESGFAVSMPVFRWPGAILGSRKVKGLGEVEFIASDADNLVLIATNDKVYAISPVNVRQFETSFQRTLEMGSLSPFTPRSAKPIAFFQSVWEDRAARLLLLVNFVFALLLWVLTGFVIANNPLLPLGYSSQGIALELVPAEQMMLLPVVNSFVLVMDLGLGMYFYTRMNEKLPAYLLWLGGGLTSIVLMAAVILFAFAA